MIVSPNPPAPAAERGREADGVNALREELAELHARLCRGLGDPKRLLIIVALRSGERSVGELAQFAGASHSNVSQHLAMLRDLGLVATRRVDANVYYRLRDERLGAVVDLLRAIQADLRNPIPLARTEQ